MAKLKLPEALRAWKIVTPNDDGSEIESYSVVRKNDDGSKTEAKLTYFELVDELYTDEDVAYLKEEADFLNNVKAVGDFTCYLDVLAEDTPGKKLSLYILTENYPTLASIMENRISQYAALFLVSHCKEELFPNNSLFSQILA